MLFKFLNLTGKTISMRNAKTNKSKELISSDGIKLFDCSQLTDEPHEFNALSKYLVIQVAIAESIVDEPVWACILPIPAPVATIQVMYATIGYSSNQASIIANFDCVSQEPETYYPGKDIEVTEKYLKFKSLFIGLGQYIIDIAGTVSDIKEDVYLTLEKQENIQYKPDTLYNAKIIKVEDIDDFMGAQKVLTTGETFQLGVTVFAIIVICVAIFVLVFSELRNHINDIKKSKE